jgi:threonine/homoserine/homoserine lactone efflux protein
MFGTTTLLAFLAASIAIILTPGPAQALVLARSLGEGRKAGILTGIGLNVGTLVHTLAAALGLSAILASSTLAFTIVKILGAGYLVYLGLQSLGAKNQPHAISRTVATNSYQAFTKAMITGILNPKVALFFLAFLPQFVNPARGFAFWQFLTLGAILALLDTGYETMLAIVASMLSQRLILNPHFMLWRQRLTGAVLVGLGVRLALTQRI